ncbi:MULTISPECIES: glycosyltransferase family 9 protein [Arenibacter]|jgi:ADP-heptose:LPS heptosyltransferase|uniref:glycosyltransferase family 9 protein n=1 Tax=Arenibacter TaxID=178469 RepID=UPI0029370D76|nr:glycosyltransferase family 9 protein [Arenibacter catalasegens]
MEKEKSTSLNPKRNARDTVKKTPPEATKKKHLLVIRLSAMGDVAMTVPVLTALVQQHPGIRVTVLTRGFFNPIFHDLENVSIYEADVKGKHKGVIGLWKLYKELKGLNIHMVADLHNVLRSNLLKMYFKVESIPFVQINKGRTEKKAITSFNKKVFRQLKTTHQRYADVFEKLGLPIDLARATKLPKRSITSSTRQLVDGKGKKWIGIAPFAAFDGKMYPLDLMEKVVDSLNESALTQILLFGGGKKEQEQLEKWETKFSNCINIVGKLPFHEELALISQLDLMLAMDSGNAHLASLFGIPTITVWGVTHPYTGFYPFGQNFNFAMLADRDKYPLIPTSVYGNKYPPGYENAMRTISPKDVILKIEETLKK